jgi:hypothetical protein
MKKRPYLRLARAFSGILAVATLMFMLVGDFLGVAVVEPARVQLLIALIGALLGVDMLLENLPLNITVEQPGEDDSE